MAATTSRLLERVSLKDGDAMVAADAPDLGDGATLEIVATVHQAAEGDSPTLALRHSPMLDEEAWLEFPIPVRVDLTHTGRTWVHVQSFTRYVGWSISGVLSSSAIVTVDLVAKG